MHMSSIWSYCAIIDLVRRPAQSEDNVQDTIAILKKAESTAKGLEAKDADSGKYYVKVMSKVAEKPDFVTKETERLQKMIDDGSVKPDKKTQFGRRLNILSSFA